MSDLSVALHEQFPELRDFLPGQREALTALLRKDDVVAVLPTGGGKTLVYQLAGHLLGGTTVVVTPLLALMHDQVRRLKDHGARPVGWVSGNVRGREREALLRRFGDGELGFCFTTPEQLARDDLRRAVARANITLLCIDEAHCISEWGFDFRPAYRELGQAAALMGRPPVLALTATAPQAVITDIARELHLRTGWTKIARGFDRNNLHFGVERVTDPDRRDRRLARVLGDLAVPAVVYCSTRREAEETAAALRAGNSRWRTAAYHGGMDRPARERAQNSFLEGALDVLCATSAFGMGIDKPDIRTIIHRTMPDSVESYWQEAGRAGRDGKVSDCILFYRPEDRAVHEHLHRRSRPSETTLAKMVHLASQVRSATPEVDVVQRLREHAEVARSGASAVVEDLARFGYLSRFRTGVRWRGEPFSAMEELARHQKIQVEVESSRLDMIATYAETSACRRRFLLNYLGDEYPAELCLRCDNCLRLASQRSTDDWDIDRQDARRVARRTGPFDPGEVVRHPEWGAGTVQRIDGEVVVVRFEAVGYRSMHAPTVVERGLLQPAS
ncbi:MAG: RecQ family ATP-dependent DNA helicase [Egibacteraceae bacterium]